MNFGRILEAKPKFTRIMYLCAVTFVAPFCSWYGTWRLSRKVPELVRTSLMTLLPERLSATMDRCTLALPSLTRWSHSASDRNPLYTKILGCHDTALTRDELNGGAGATPCSAAPRRSTGTTAVATSRSARTSSTPRSLIPAGGDRSRVREEEEIRNRARDTAGGRASFIPGAWVFFLWVSRTFARYVGGRRGFFPL